MTSPFAFDPPTPVSLSIEGSPSHFPVRRVYGVGKNYAAHVREMGGDPAHEPPMLFAKFPNCVGNFSEIPYPRATNDLHYEGELVVALGSGGQPADQTAAVNLIFGYGVGIDFTRRDRQGSARKRGGPWEVAKCFPCAGPVSPLVALPHTLPEPEARLLTHVNGALRQRASLAQMVWSIPALIMELAVVFDLAAGDLIFTGTPAGVGPVVPGDRVEVSAGNLGRLSVTIGAST